MANIEKGWHCVYTLKYHIVWVTKNRYNKFFGQVEKDTKETLKQIAQDYDWEIEELEMMPDHIHLYVATEPTDRPSDVVKRLKEESSKKMGRKYPYLKNKKGAVWGRGYFISSVNDKTTAQQIKKYIRNQKAVAAQGKLFD
jgi:putative transposase